MKIDGKVHCFFEQSGTFKNEFIKLGIPAEDYDIQNHFAQTDHVIDLFSEIEKAYDGKDSVFDGIKSDDLIMAFFPCIYFTGSINLCYYMLENINYKNLTDRQKFEKILERSRLRQEFYELIIKLVCVCVCGGLRLIIENPYNNNGLSYLQNNFIKSPDIIDRNRSLRGDYFVKPTGYWFFNCEPTNGETIIKNNNTKAVFEKKGGDKAGICSEERSMISPLYAHNFICDFILGKATKYTQQKLFEL